ncbi:hypothetical protein SAMN02910369_02186 [Lachnospiraceae bacterium NE2001]|nr:hypothetical protein SAMN02910369_02186 [Lachnospiraceae bacterium NE2001]
MSDGGYLTTFNALKQQIDYNYRQYKEQLAGIEQRKLELKNETKSKGLVVATILFAPLVFYLFVLIFMYLGSRWGFFGIFYFIFIGLMILSIGVGEFFLLLPAVRNFFNAHYRYRVLCNDDIDEVVKKKTGVITFSDEEVFLLGKITAIDIFYEKVKKEALDKGENYRLVEAGEMTDYARSVLDEMREKSLFKEYRATNASMRREAGYEWVILCFGLLISIIVILCL